MEAALDQLARLIAESPHNLVSRSERSDLRRLHVDEASAVFAHLPVQPGQRWLDLGTGGGLPGLVLAILSPDVNWVLVDATAKKVAAVHEFARALGLLNVTTVAARAEVLAHDPEHRAAYHGVVSRAVAGLPTLLELARGFLRPGGRFAGVKGPAWRDELASAAVACATLGYGPSTVVEVPEAVRPTWLVTMPATGSPPDGFPRRTGLPRTSPLGVVG